MAMYESPDKSPDLIDRLKAGDRTASDELFTQMYRRLVQLSGFMLGTFADIRRQHDAESLVHCAWIDLQTTLRSVQPDDVAGYLRLAAGKARLALLDLAKKERRRIDKVPLRPDPAGHDDSTVDFEPAAGSSCDPGRLELWSRFHDAVSELPDELRNVFELYSYTDVKPNQAQIAKILGLPARQVSRRIARAKDQLAERVSGLCEMLS
jgi:RNA polymerase sigma factor (sigma-70 family)